jgi:hypothetical protein
MEDIKMSTIDLAFVKQFESEVHEYFQRKGSKLDKTCRSKTGVKGKSTTFQTYGTATAVKKTRNGDVPQSHPAHGPVECLLEDWYVQIPIDKLDMLKVDHDEKEVALNASVAALGQKKDDIIITQLDATSRFVGDFTEGLGDDLLDDAIEKYWETDPPEDTESYAALSNRAWRQFKKISEVSNADFVGDMKPHLKGRKAFDWEEIIWMHHTGLPVDGADRTSFIYHKSSVGVAVGQDIETDWWWNGKAQEWLLTLKMSCGAKLIDERGVVELRLDDVAAPAS